jgi:hypothetical protein
VGIREQAKRIAAGATVALATSGLSSCNDNGAVDPLPPPLQCNTVGMGQSLDATGTLRSDTVEVTISNTLGHARWQVERIVDVTNGTLVSTRLPAPRSQESLGVVIRLATPTTQQASFTVEATLIGPADDTCTVRRTFDVLISTTGVQISMAGSDPLPLAARQRAEIVLAHHEGRVVELQARTPYHGEREFAWTVTHGELDSSTGESVRWTLPGAPGIYQAELVIDFGRDGFAFDVLLLEVVSA